MDWEPIFLAVTDREISFYSSVPWTTEAWAAPIHSYPLVHTRFVLLDTSTLKSTSNPQHDYATFSLRVGMRHGIEQKIIRVETQRDMALWAKSIVDGAHNAALFTKEASFGKYLINLIFLTTFPNLTNLYFFQACICGSTECILTIHIRHGFTLRDTKTFSVIWSFPFESLLRSSDDSKKTLSLVFKDVPNVIVSVKNYLRSGCFYQFFIVGTGDTSRSETRHFYPSYIFICETQLDRTFVVSWHNGLFELHSIEPILNWFVNVLCKI